MLHRLHVRNLVSSGLTEKLTARGHRLVCLVSERDWADLPWETRKGLEFCPAGQFQGPPWRGRLRRFLMLGTMVAREPGSRTFQHKLAHEHRSRGQIALWRAIRRGADPEAVARRIEALLPPQRSARALVATVRPDALLWPSTFAQANEELEVVKAGRAARVPILAMPASWDTLTSKPSPLIRPDRLLVWGEASAGHAQTMGLRADIVGPPHFDCYADPWDGPRKPVAFVAGTSLHFWRDEREIVEALDRESRADWRGWTVRYRPHPSRLKDRAFAAPQGVILEDRLGYDLHPGFQEHLRDRLAASACVVAAFSTVIIEAALMGCPSIVPGFAQSAKGPFGILEHKNYEHMAEVVAWPGIHVMRTLPGLIGAVRKAVAGTLYHDPAELRHRALRIARVGGAQERIIAAIESA